MNPRILFQNLRRTPRMYLLDDQYLTVVAFVTGYNAATDGKLLEGFQEWVAEQVGVQETSLHWATLVASRHVPVTVLRGKGPLCVPATNAPAVIDDLLDLLDRFLADRNDSR